MVLKIWKKASWSKTGSSSKAGEFAQAQPGRAKNIQLRHLNCNEVAEGLEAKLHERITTAVVTELQGSRTTSKVEGAV